MFENEQDYSKLFGSEGFSYKAIRPHLSQGCDDCTAVGTTPSQAMFHKVAGPEDTGAEPIFYISDIHLCHQLDLVGKSLDEVKELIEARTSKLVDSLTSDHGVIIVAGDVADSVELTVLFYRTLAKELEARGGSMWRDWKVVAVPGNHELWDGNPCGSKPVRPISEVMADLRSQINYFQRATFMQNTMLRLGKINSLSAFWSYGEEKLINSTEEEIKEWANSSPLILFGGLGFTGCNKHRNTAANLYGKKPGDVDSEYVPRLTLQEDKAESEKFKKLYDKLLRCLGDRRIIVVTHTPMEDWSDKVEYNPNWVYISGHTHQNRVVREKNGTTILADNQIGYDPRPWVFNSFTFQGWFDPFETWNEGIYPIETPQYELFNKGRGITMARFKRSGQIYMIKRAGVYMFFLEGKSLLMLSGGRIKRTEHSLQYYYDNLSTYVHAVRSAFAPYRSALETLSAEVKAFGGTGFVHGCIVDIDPLNHIYLNPRDGTITPYFAWSMMEKYVYESVRDLLLDTSSEPPLLGSDKSLAERYGDAEEAGKLPIMASHHGKEQTALATVPRMVTDTSMYDPSRIMRSVQYIFDQDVVRIWNDEVFGENVPEDKYLPEPAEKKRPGRPRETSAMPKPAPLSPEERLRQRAERYAKKVAERSGRKLEVDTNSYVSSKDNVTVCCTDCGYTWSLRADHLLNRYCCPNCDR